MELGKKIKLSLEFFIITVGGFDMTDRFSINKNMYDEIFFQVMRKAEQKCKCKKILNDKNDLFEREPESAEILLELDKLLSDYYNEALQIMYTETLNQIIKIFYCED